MRAWTILAVAAVGCVAGAVEPALRLIPQPQRVEVLPGTCDWATPVRVVFGDPQRVDDRFAADQLAAELRLDLDRGLADSAAATARPLYLGLVADAPIAAQTRGLDLAPLAAAGPDAYLLLVEPDRLLAAGNSPAGTFYAVQTLKQLLRANRDGTRIPAVRILDWPGLPRRGYLDDITRGPIPTVDFLRREIRTMAEMKMNLLTFYTEHVFKLEKHPGLAPDDGLTAAEVRELSAFARQYHVELVGCFQSFGHMGNILRHPQYAALRETGDVLSPVREETYGFLGEVYAEVATAYESPWFLVCCDETYGLGQGPSKELAGQIGVGGVYVRHVNRLHDLLRDSFGKRMLMWGDIALEHPTIVQQLAKDTVLLSWGYAAAPDYRAAIEPFTRAGFEFLVCPGVSCWSAIFPNYENATVNIRNYVRDGAKYGALGVLNTTWDDDGENLFRWNFYGTSWGAACAWRPADADLDAYNAAFGPLSHGTPDDKITRAITALAACVHNPLTQGNMDPAFWVRPARALTTTLDTVLAQSRDLVERTTAAIALLDAARPEAKLDPEDLDALRFAARRLQWIGAARERHLLSAREYAQALAAFPQTDPARQALQAALAGARTTAAEVAALRTEYERLWRLENRESSLTRILARYDALLADLNAYATTLEAAAAELARTGVPPDPTDLGLAVVETSRREVTPVPAAEPLLPATAPWWDARRPLRLPLRVEAPTADLTDYPLEVRVNLAPQRVDPAAVCVIEYVDGQPTPTPLAAQFDPAADGTSGRLAFIVAGTTRAKTPRLFAVYAAPVGQTPPPAAPPAAGIKAWPEEGSVWVENARFKALVGPRGAHVFEWCVKALDNLELTAPGRTDWAGFSDTGAGGDRATPFDLTLEAAGPVLVRIRATAAAAGREKVLTFYADQPWFEVTLSEPVGYYWDFDRTEAFARDQAQPGTALFADGHREPVCGAGEQVHAVAQGVHWGAKVRADGLVFANLTPEVKATHMTGPGGGWGGVGIEGSAPAAHFVTLADRLEGDPAPRLEALRQTLDVANRPKVWVAPVQVQPQVR